MLNYGPSESLQFQLDSWQVRWGDKHGGYGEQYWEYNHAPKHGYKDDHKVEYHPPPKYHAAAA